MSQPDLFTPAFYADPYPAYRWLRTHHPVQRHPRMGWLITRYADIQALAQDPRVSRAAVEATRLNNIAEDAMEAARPVLEELQHEVRAKDPPAHAPLRRLLSSAFTPRMVERLRPRIQRLVNDLLDAAAAQGQINVIRDLAYPLPATVIMELLGVPPKDRDRLKAWTDDRVAFLGSISVASDPLSLARRAGSSVHLLTEYYRAPIAQRRREPRDDLLTAFTAVADEEDGTLTDDEIVSNAIFLLSGGHETTMHLIGNGPRRPTTASRPVGAFVRRLRPRPRGGRRASAFRQPSPDGATCDYQRIGPGRPYDSRRRALDVRYWRGEPRCRPILGARHARYRSYAQRTPRIWVGSTLLPRCPSRAS